MVEDVSKIIYHGLLNNDFWRNIDEIEVILKQLPEETVKNKLEVLGRIKMIRDKLDSLVVQARKDRLSKSTIAKMQLARNHLNFFSKHVKEYPENYSGRKAELLKLRLLGSLRNFRKSLEDALNY